MDKKVFQWTATDACNLWVSYQPRDNVKPDFSFGQKGLSISGAGGKNFGWYGADVGVSPDTHYRVRIKFSVEGMENINIHIMNLLYWTDSRRPERTGAHDAVLSYKKERDGSYIGEQIIKSPAFADTVQIQLGTRFLDGASATWHEVCLEETEKPYRKPVRVAAAGWNSMALPSREALIKEMTSLIDTAGYLGADIFVLPEFSNAWQSESKNMPADSIPDGVIPALLSQKAKQHNMNICAGLSEEDGGYLYNAGALFNRAGEFVGKYRKNHLYWPEEFFTGTLPGDGYPVFDLDFGRVGIMICYDSWYAETARLLTLKGAELILFPNAGYEEKIMPARYIDNNNYIAISSMGGSSGVMNTTGSFVAQVKKGIAYADINLDDRYCCHPNSGGSMNAGSGGQRSRMNTPSDRIYREIADEVRKFEDRPWKYTW